MSNGFFVTLNSFNVCLESTNWHFVFLSVVYLIKFNKMKIIVIFNLKISLIEYFINLFSQIKIILKFIICLFLIGTVYFYIHYHDLNRLIIKKFYSYLNI